MAQETASQAERSANLNYGYHFFEELAPVNLNYIALLNGVAPCPVENFSYCDLGCSNGVSLNVFAASYPQARFFGIDYNPNHISNANKLAKHGKLNNVKFVCKNFIDLDLKSIPKFDYIIINNLVSYLAPNEQDQLLNFIEKKLKIGGLLYISYNTMPG